MLNVNDCLQKAKRNKIFVLQILSKIVAEFPDWVTVVAFYSALHFVDAHLLKHHGIQRENHEEREREVAIHLSYIFPAYKRLKELSVRSRYYSVKDNPTSEDAKSAIKYELPKIEEYVMQHI